MGSLLESMLPLSSIFVLCPLLHLRGRKPPKLHFPGSLASQLPIKFYQREALAENWRKQEAILPMF